MKYTIITAVHNNKASLQKAIESLQAQSYKNYEHIIIDGASTDGTIDIIKEMADERTRWISEKDSSIYDAINKGIKMTAGDIIGLLHSDDIYAGPEVLSSVAKVFDENGTDAVYGDLLYVRYKAGSDADESSESHSVLRYWKTQKNDYTSIRQRDRAIKFGWMPPHPALFIKKNIYDEYGLFDRTYKIAADYEMILRLFWNKKISAYYLPEVFTAMTAGGTSNKSLANIITKSREDYKAMKINGLPFPLLTLLCKNFRKLSQFIKKN